MLRDGLTEFWPASDRLRRLLSGVGIRIRINMGRGCCDRHATRRGTTCVPDHCEQLAG